MAYKRSSIAALVTSATVLVGIAVHEGYRDEAYTPVPGDVPTIGFGTTEGVKPGQKTTPERALIALLKDAELFEQTLFMLKGLPELGVLRHEPLFWRCGRSEASHGQQGRLLRAALHCRRAAPVDRHGAYRAN